METSFDGRTTEVKREESVLRVLVFGERGAFVECGNRFVADVCVCVEARSTGAGQFCCSFIQSLTATTIVLQRIGRREEWC